MNRIALMVLRNLLKLPGAYIKLRRYARHLDQYDEQERYRHIQYIIKMAVAAGNIELKTYGQENIPAEGGFLLYGNHQGLFDALALAVTCDRPLGAVFKKELRNVPFVKDVVACTGSYAMDRADVRQSLTVIQAVTREVQSGRSYIIFPEGTRSKKGNEMLEFHAGSFRCAVKSKCPVVPVAFIDCFRVLDEKGSKPVTAQIHYLKPITCEEYAGMKAAELAELVRQRIQEALDQYAEK